MRDRHLGGLVTPLVDGQLDHDARDRALAHLASCAVCQAEVAVGRALKARLGALEAPAVPERLAARLLGLGAAMAAGPQEGMGEQAAPWRPPPQGVGLPSRRTRGRLLRAQRTDGRALPAPLPAWPQPQGADDASHGDGHSGRPPRGRATPYLRRRLRVRTAIAGSAAIVLIAVAGSTALSDVRPPAVPAQPVAVPTDAGTGVEPVPPAEIAVVFAR